MTVISSRYRRRLEAIEASVPLDDVMKPEQFWDLLQLYTPTACEHCGEAFFGFKAGARHCSTACRVRGHRQSRRPEGETPEDRRLNQRDGLEMKTWYEVDPTWSTRARQVTWTGSGGADDPSRKDNPEPSPRVPGRSLYRCSGCGVALLDEDQRRRLHGLGSAACTCTTTWVWDVATGDFIDQPPRPAPIRKLPILDGDLGMRTQAKLEGAPPATVYDPVWEAARLGEGARAISARQEPTDRPGKRGKLDVRVSWQECRIQTGAEHDRDTDYDHEQWWLPEHERRSPSSRSSARWSFSDEPWVLDVPEVRSLGARLLLTAEELLDLPDHVLTVIEGLPIANPASRQPPASHQETHMLQPLPTDERLVADAARLATLSTELAEIAGRVAQRFPDREDIAAAVDAFLADAMTSAPEQERSR